MAFCPGKKALFELAEIFGVRGCSINGMTLEATVRGAVIAKFSHVVTDVQMERIKSVLRECAEDADIRHGFTFSGEAREFDMVAAAGE